MGGHRGCGVAGSPHGPRPRVSMKGRCLRWHTLARRGRACQGVGRHSIVVHFSVQAPSLIIIISKAAACPAACSPPGLDCVCALHRKQQCSSPTPGRCQTRPVALPLEPRPKRMPAHAHAQCARKLHALPPHPWCFPKPTASGPRPRPLQIKDLAARAAYRAGDLHTAAQLALPLVAARHTPVW